MANPPEVEEFVYSVWALPPEGVRDRLKGIMSTLLSEFGGPEFEPHITVVGATRLTPAEALRRFRSPTATLSPYTARISAPSSGTFFYQCVYLLIDPTAEVVEASAHCCNHFGYKNSTPYMPHLSLLYGDLTNEEKEKARQRVVELDKEIHGLSFEVSSIALYRTDTEDKSLKSWEKIEVINLGNDKYSRKVGLLGLGASGSTKILQEIYIKKQLDAQNSAISMFHASLRILGPNNLCKKSLTYQLTSVKNSRRSSPPTSTLGLLATSEGLRSHPFTTLLL